ncbi:unnamed protein product [Arctia plantaginis]|uniref:Uncharacterized protein n=1 Tax=Arctia plantaginis TaxID=874455 RepID=A0A8S0ZWB0_ARCPL|nr:unnamed protein product [Arctia plantaginis]
MIRSSGCLATICELFTNCMMNQDTWQSLCRCLAETCRNVEANQSYCTHLVPACVQRCSQRNIEVLLVLQSLLQNHERNVNLFFKCNGISLFRREILKHEICLQLLDTIVQSSEQAIELINKTDTYQYLVDFLRLYGPESQLGQWATIILYHMSRTKGTCVIPIPKQEINEKQNTDNPDIQNTINTTGFFQNVIKEIIQCGLLPAQFQNKTKNSLFIQSHSNQNRLQPNETCTQNTSVIFNNCNIQKCAKISNDLIEGKQNNRIRDLSFSFLYQEDNRRYTHGSICTNKINNACQKTPSNAVNIRKFSKFCEPASLADNLNCRDTPELSSFAPKCVSTPKKTYYIEPKKSTMRYVKNSTCTIFSDSIGKHKRKRMIRSRKDLSKVASFPKCLEQTNSDKENRHRSITERFLGAVNESCTTLVKTIKNIFTSKHSSKESKIKGLTPVSETSTKSCSYSFTNYMRERDAILKNENTKEFNDDFDDFSMEMTNTCSSCNDTVVLKQKLANDEYLKQTIRKLKLGINLYGCDFKKISKQLWPHQTYMTPVVLYNLYRKLIIK